MSKRVCNICRGLEEHFADKSDGCIMCLECAKSFSKKFSHCVDLAGFTSVNQMMLWAASRSKKKEAGRKLRGRRYKLGLPYCNAQSPRGFLCKRKSGHKGEHASMLDPTQPLQLWGDKRAGYKPRAEVSHYEDYIDDNGKGCSGPAGTLTGAPELVTCHSCKTHLHIDGLL